MALIPPSFMDCVVAIGVDDPQGKRRWIASGFLYGHFLRTEEDEKKTYSIFLVTNRHVLGGKDAVYLRFNPEAGGAAREYRVGLTGAGGKPTWFSHPNERIDVAVAPLNFGLLRKDGIQAAYFTSDEVVAPVEKLNELGVTEGDFAYVLGFPMGLVGEERSTVIVRSGTIARIRDTLARANEEFLVDAFVFPGNSGGPIVLKPEVTAIAETKPQRRAYLIGLVRQYVAYTELAVSEQTGRPRVMFEENSGLAAAHPIDYVQETVMAHFEFEEATGEKTNETQEREQRGGSHGG